MKDTLPQRGVDLQSLRLAMRAALPILQLFLGHYLSQLRGP